jgi:hypothetical protein
MRMIRTMAAVVAAVLGMAGTAGATTYGWDGGGDGANWSSGTNWNPNAPAGGPGSGDIVHHNTLNQTANITVDQNVTIANARVKWDGAGNPVTSYWTANWTDDGAGRTVSVTQSLEVMHGYSSSVGSYAGITATLNLSNLHLAIGTASQPAALEVARKASSTVNEPTKGNLIVSGGRVTAYLNHFILGRNMGGAGTAAGTVNLSNCEDVMIDLAGTAYVGAYVASGQVSALNGYKTETYPRLKILNSGTSPMAAKYWDQVSIVYSDPAAGGTGYTYVGFMIPPSTGTLILFR